MATEPLKNASRSQRSGDSRASPAVAGWWRPVDALDDMAIVEKSLDVLEAVASDEASRANEDADALDPRVQLLCVVSAEYLRPERRDPWLTILNKHVQHAIGRETVHPWKAFAALHQACARKHEKEAALAKVPMVMFCRCRGDGRKRPTVWQLWILDGTRRTSFSLPEPPYVSAHAVLDDSLLSPGDPPLSPRPPAASTTETDEAELPVAPAPRQTSTQPPPPVTGCATGTDGVDKSKPHRSAESQPLDTRSPVVAVARSTSAPSELVGYAIVSWATVGALSLSISLLVIAAVIGASAADVAAALRDLFNIAWRGVRF